MASKKSRRGITRYKSYMWVDKDPILNAIKATISEKKVKFSQINEAGGPTVKTLKAWNSGNVRRPQFTTVAATTRALGKNGVMFDAKGNPYLVD